VTLGPLENAPIIVHDSVPVSLDHDRSDKNRAPV